MSASAQSGHSIVDQPATAQTCSRDYEAAQSQRSDPQGHHYADDRGALGTGQQHTHR
ncbi:hypothetical protein OG730_34865 [Streptomyces sp. NBC_01298]|uniref:hypothetical protein n=1 Tax=Streptomyces sp. NBC_01298 TaxID=2903817 RepID=UPI002E114D43|nr:hypothetical protein OG730_34865 [Streptomyces sp. NBC_01298]